MHFYRSYSQHMWEFGIGIFWMRPIQIYLLIGPHTFVLQLGKAEE